MKMIKYLLIISLSILNIQFAFSHEGGHYHKGDEYRLRVWDYTLNGSPLRGNFSYYKNGYVYIEMLDGKFAFVPLKSLRNKDKEYAEKEMLEFSNVNTFSTKLPLPKYRELNFPLVLTYLAGAIIFILIAYLIWLLISALDINFLLERKKILLYWLTVGFSFSVFVLIACKKNDGNNTTLTLIINKTDTSFFDSIFAPFKSSVSTSYDSNYYYVSSNGIPSDQVNMMVGINSWQQQVPIPQPYNGNNVWSIPLQPELATNPLSLKTNLMSGAVAIAANGIPIFNALNNRGDDAYLTGELDNWGGHCGKADDYHYHVAPLFLQEKTKTKPIAIALDGFPIYGTVEPDGIISTYTLDTCNGHTYYGRYHYHGTKSYPYIMGAMRGKVILDPSSIAPENLIIPQARTTAFRPAGSPLRGASITDFSSTGINAYSLEYTLGGKKGYLKYSWDNSGMYTFISIDTSGISTRTTFKR